MTDERCFLAGKFKLWEKIYAQVCFFGIGIIGTVGIILVDWFWVFPYIFIIWYGIPGIVQRHLVCPRCPHLHEYGDCIQLHPSITKRLIKKRKTGPFTALEKFLFYTIFILIPIYPIYWLLRNKLLLVGFIICAIGWYSGQFFYFCKRCRVKVCPFNRVTI